MIKTQCSSHPAPLVPQSCFGVPPSAITDELQQICSLIIDQMNDLPGALAAVVFGSRVRRPIRTDIDFKILLDRDPDPATRAITARFSRALHRRFAPGIGLRNLDVPYTRKTVIGPTIVAGALSLRPYRTDGGRIEIPPIWPDRFFLRSDECQMRTTLNALTTPHLLLGGDGEEHRALCERAFGSVLSLVEGAYGIDRGDWPAVRAHLLASPSGSCGKQYLGYSKDPAVVSWLFEQWRRETSSDHDS